MITSAKGRAKNATYVSKSGGGVVPLWRVNKCGGTKEGVYSRHNPGFSMMEIIMRC